MTSTQRQIIIWLSAVLLVTLGVSLGCWQLRRADQKRSAYVALTVHQQQVAWGNHDWPCDGAAMSASSLHRPVVLRGHWLVDHTVFLDNRPMDGGSGFIVVTPLVLSDMAPHCAGRVVLVERGWVPRDLNDRTRIPVFPTSSNEVIIGGRVSEGISRVYQLGQEPEPAQQAAPLIRQNADSLFWAKWLGQSPLVGSVLQLEADKPTPLGDVLRRSWPVPGQGEGKHLAYAAQWFALSALFAGLTLWFQIILPRRQRAHVQS